MKKHIKLIIIVGLVFCAGLIAGHCYRYYQNFFKVTAVTGADNNTTKDTKKIEKISSSNNKNTNVNVGKNTVNKDIVFNKKDTTKQPNFNSSWKPSPDNLTSICIEGKGEDITEEGIGTIYLKDKNNKFKTIQCNNSKKISPVYVEWIDNNKIFVIIGNSYGSVSQNKTLYSLNINTMESRIIYSAKDNESIQNVSIKDKKINLKLKVYDDTNFNKFHNEDKMIETNEIL